MKLRFVRLMSLILAFLMLLSLATACSAGEETETEAATTGNTETEGATEKQPSVQKKDYGTEFTAFYCEDIFPIDYYLIEEDRRKPGNDMDDRVYERMLNIKEHLGVEMERNIPVCHYSHMNNQCIGKKCPYNKANHK